MITKPAFSKTIYAALFATAMLLGSSAAFAQVKIGTNPTSINAANNLEVEASTTGRKTSIDKTTGQVTIKDGTEGAKKVLTSDANGGASWQNAACGSFEATGASQIVPINNLITDPYTVLIPNTETFDPLNAFNPATGEYVVPATGMYIFKASGGDYITGVVTGSRNSTIAIISAQKGPLTYSVTAAQVYGGGSWNNVVSVNYLTAGDVITFRTQITHVSGTKPSATISFEQIKFSGSRLDCNTN